MRDGEQGRLEAQLKAVTAALEAGPSSQPDEGMTKPTVIQEMQDFMRAAPKAVATASPDTGGSSANTGGSSWDSSANTGGSSGGYWDSPTDTGEASGSSFNDADKPGSPGTPTADDDEEENPFARKCKNCQSHGHWANACPEKKDPVKCYNCGEVGHIGRVCPKPQQEKKPVECFKCYQTGHVSKDCPNEKVYKCSNCSQIGHFRKECPKPRDLSKVQCHKCQKFGHIAAKCDQPTASSSQNADDGFDPIESTGTGDNWGANASTPTPDWATSASTDGWEAGTSSGGGW